MLLSKNRKSERIQTESLADPHPSEELEPVIIVHGAASTKVGLGGELYPRFVLPTQSTLLSEKIRSFPLEGSKPTNEELLKAYWEAIITKLDVDLSNRKVLVSLPTANLTECPFRELVLDHFYNELNAYKIGVVSDPFLSLVGYVPQIKTLTALIVDIGFSQIRIVPIFQAAILEDHIAQFSFGGFNLTLTLGTWLQNKGFEGPINSLFLRDIKENFCSVKPFKQTVIDKKEEELTYTIDKYNFQLGSERWKLPELLFFKDYFSKKVEICPRSEFNGNRYQFSDLTLPRAIGFVIKSLHNKLWSSMIGNICLTGGGAKFEGLYQRLKDELQFIFPEFSKQIKIRTIPNTDLTPFIGASKLSELPSFQKYWRTIEDCEEGIYDLFL